MRKISDKFQKDLISGILYPILSAVLKDNNITIEIRKNYINAYYRGSNMLRIREKNPGYKFEFDLNYIIGDDSSLKSILSKLPSDVSNSNDVIEWSSNIALIKSVIDNYLVLHKKSEREFQQLVVRENNTGSIAGKTDYYICDIEYQTIKTRFDFIAVKKNGGGKFRLAFIEMKYADSAIYGKSGIVDHVSKAYDYLISYEYEILKKEMLGILQIKQNLGLLKSTTNCRFTDEKPEFIFLLSNHKPTSSLLESEIHNLRSKSFYADFCTKADLKFATASFFGYGLYNDCIYSVDEFEELNQGIVNITKNRKIRLA